MNVHMRHLLEGRWTDRMPHSHALIGKRMRYRSRDSDDCIHHRSASSWIKLAYVIDVYPRNHQNMARIVLPRIDKRGRQLVPVDDIRRRATRHDLAKHALGTQVSLPF